MRILFLGAGGTGGYFGGRAAQAGADVSFLLRGKRAKAVIEEGLRLCSPRGDALIRPNVETAGTLKTAYDLVVLSCKAYDIDSAIEAIRPAVGRDTAILPIMNGMLQYDILDREFGADRVLGGLCQINATLGAEGEVRHWGPYANLVFGERSGETRSPRCLALEAALAEVDFSFRLSTEVVQDCWEKYVFLTSLAAATCLMRGSVGSIVSTNDGEAFLRALLGEAQSVAQASGYAVRRDADAAALKVFTDAKQPMTASMFRDLSQGNPVEADHIVGDMVRRASQKGLETPYLRLAYAHLQVYQAQRLLA